MTVGESETWGEENDGPEADSQAGREAGSRPKRLGRGGPQPHVITVTSSAPLRRVGGRQKWSHLQNPSS